MFAGGIKEWPVVDGLRGMTHLSNEAHCLKLKGRKLLKTALVLSNWCFSDEK